jgi:hypothetical protein
MNHIRNDGLRIDVPADGGLRERIDQDHGLQQKVLCALEWLEVRVCRSRSRRAVTLID